MSKVRISRYFKGREYGSKNEERDEVIAVYMVRSCSLSVPPKYTLHTAGHARVNPRLSMLMIGLSKVAVAIDGGIPLCGVNQCEILVSHQSSIVCIS